MKAIRIIRSLVINGLALIGLVALFSFPGWAIWDGFENQYWEDRMIRALAEPTASLPLFKMWLPALGLLLLLGCAPFLFAALVRYTRWHLHNTPKFKSRLRIAIKSFRVVLIAVAVFSALVGFWLIHAWHHPPLSQPLVSLTPIGYTNVTLNPANPSAIGYPGRGKWVQVRVKNEGNESISFGSLWQGAHGWANVETHLGSTNLYLEPSRSETSVLRPGSTITFSVILPTNTVRWQYTFSVASASLRDRAICRIIGSGFYERISDVFFEPVQFLPNIPGPALEVKSPMLEITNATSHTGANVSLAY